MKRVIVFGGSGVIGKEVCEVLRTSTDRYDHNEYMVYNADIMWDGEQRSCYQYVECDILNHFSVYHVFQHITNTYGPVYAVINCTYPKTQRYMTQTWMVESDSDYLTFFNHHLISNISLCKMAKEHKVENIVLLSSIYGKMIPIDWMYHGSRVHKPPLEYGMAKAAINYLVRYLSPEIHINAISPGGIESDKQDRAFKNRYGKFTKVNEVASMVKFLLSEPGMGINGQVITIDGGFSV